MEAVVATGLKKSYGQTPAVADVSFAVQHGELFGLIGPDGAGKTTLFRILTSLLAPDSGQAHVLGLDTVGEYRELRKKVGYMPGRFSLYQDLSVEENLSFFASIFGASVEQNYHLIEDIYRQIEPFRKRRAGALSGGMKQKLALSCALIHEPEILFLDEPTTGVDAVSRREFWQMLARLKARGITILVSTPYMDEASLCDRVALMQNGRILHVDAPDRIGASFTRPLFAVRGPNRHRLIQAVRAYSFTHSAYSFGEWLHVADVRDEADPDELRDYLSMHGFAEVEVEPVAPGIEDAFMELMGNPVSPEPA